MADITTGPLPGGPSPLPKSPTGLMKGATPAEPQPKVGTDALTLSAGAAQEPQFFGHAPNPGHKNMYALSMFMKQPLWADTREDITGEQWAQMPQSQRDEILKLIPTEPAKAQFLSNMDPKVVQAKKELGAMAKKAWGAAQEWSAKQDAKRAAAGEGTKPEAAKPDASPTSAQTEATLDRLADAKLD